MVGNFFHRGLGVGFHVGLEFFTVESEWGLGAGLFNKQRVFGLQPVAETNARDANAPSSFRLADARRNQI